MGNITRNSLRPTPFPSRVFVLLGDSEMAEGQVWEAMEIASYYKLYNLIGILDVNRLGQSRETMLGWDLETYRKRVEAFGWRTIVVDDGHDHKKVENAYQLACHTNLKSTEAVNNRLASSSKPVMIIAKTIKGKGVSFLENKDGWHGKPVPKEMLESAIKELGKIDLTVRGKITLPLIQNLIFKNKSSVLIRQQSVEIGDLIATREAYGEALVALGKVDPSIVVLDGETSNSTYADKFAKAYPDRYFEMFIAEQNMVSTALGLSKIGYTPFASTFAAFLTRTFDQIRMAQYSDTVGSRAKGEARNKNEKLEMGNVTRNSLHPTPFSSASVNLKLVGSHAGVSIGSDGPSQMALEDIAMMRSILNSTVLYPSDAVSAFKLTQKMAASQGFIYMRTTREKTPVIYPATEDFPIGGLKILRQSPKDKAVVITAGITLHEALKAYAQLKQEQINIAVVDLYSVKPIDVHSLQVLAQTTKNIIVVEDHYPTGGIGEAVLTALNSNYQTPRNKKISNSNIQKSNKFESLSLNVGNFLDTCELEFGAFNFIHLCVRKIPRSGTPLELLRFEEIDAEAIIKAVKSLIRRPWPS